MKFLRIILFPFILFSILFFSCQTTQSSRSARKTAQDSSNQILSDDQIDSIIKDSEIGFYPVTINGKPDKLFSDIDGDGIDDILVIYVSADTVNSTELSSLQSSNRVYDETTVNSEFTLIAFANSGTDLTKQKTVLLGSYKAINKIEKISITENEGPNQPVVLSISFTDAQESTTKIVSFKGFSIATVLDLKRDGSSGFYLKDLNNDNFPEIIKYKQTHIDGVGYDTRLSLYQWDGQKYSFTDSRLIIQELNNFLSKVKSYIENDDREALLNSAFPPLKARKYLKQKLEMSAILKMIFQPADLQSKPIRKPKQILFGKVQENPFQLQNIEREQSFQIYCRMIFGNLNSDFYKATIVLNENPFTDIQYYFNW